jgi:hypothetical protein
MAKRKSPGEPERPATPRTSGAKVARFESERHAAALQRIAAADARILVQEERIRALKADGHQTAESERLLDLMRLSRDLMQEQADLLKDKT